MRRELEKTQKREREFAGCQEGGTRKERLNIELQVRNVPKIRIASEKWSKERQKEQGTGRRA